MAHDVYLEGALFPAVPSVLLPDGNNVLNRFTDVSDTTAQASDVAQGKQFYDASGILTVGTASGGGGGSAWNLIYSSVLTGISTTSINAVDITTIQLGSGAFTSDAILWIHIRDTAGPRDGYFYGTDSICINTSAYGGADTSFSAMAYQTLRRNNRFYCYATRYGVYPTSINSNGELIVRARYHSTYSLTINGDYSVNVYKLTPPSSNWLFG